MMKAFGIELRKANNLENLYDDVDRILDAVSIRKDGISKEIQSSTIAHALQKMIKPSGYLDITTIRNCADITGICISKERMNVYSCMHCIYWNEMTDDHRQVMIAMILDDFRTILQ